MNCSNCTHLPNIEESCGVSKENCIDNDYKYWNPKDSTESCSTCFHNDRGCDNYEVKECNECKQKSNYQNKYL